MAFIVGVAFILVVVVLATATRRAKLRSCCAVADPRQDLRMRAAFIDEDPRRQGS